jgi:hypothetical protein
MDLMELDDCQRMHITLDAVGMRSQGTAVGLLQLCKELLDAGVLEKNAVVRIREAIVADISLNCPRSVRRETYQDMVRQRLDGILQPLGSLPAHATTEPIASH